MALFESTLALLLGAVILTGVARRVGVPYPSLLAIAGAALAAEIEQLPSFTRFLDGLARGSRADVGAGGD